MCGFFFAKYRRENNNESISDFLEKECNLYIKNRGPSFQESYRSKSFFAYQSVLSIQSDSIRSSKINPLGSKKFFLYNGEIYGLNKKKELSDTEYLFKKWEEGELEKTLKTADGMYALAALNIPSKNRWDEVQFIK